MRTCEERTKGVVDLYEPMETANFLEWPRSRYVIEIFQNVAWSSSEYDGTSRKQAISGSILTSLVSSKPSNNWPASEMLRLLTGLFVQV